MKLLRQLLFVSLFLIFAVQGTDLESFKLPEGFEITLVAKEPLLTNPVSMAVDEDGRIYISNAHSYRQPWWLMKPAPKMTPSNPIIRITVGADGKMKESETVAEGFKDPVMGLTVHGNRLWATNLNRVFIAELNETGKIKGNSKDLIRDAATPWNPFGMYRLFRGPDGLIYMTVGDHKVQLSGADGKVSVRQDYNGSGGVFRFHENGSQLELLTQGMRAPFSLGFTPYGKMWVVSNGEGSPNFLIDAIYGNDYRFRNKSRGQWSWLAGEDKLAAPVWQTGPGAVTAALPYYSANFPTEYWGSLFVANFGIHGSPAKHNNIMQYKVDDQDNIIRREIFLSSSDSKFRPTQVSLAPDGGLYVLDWYGKDDENDLTGRLYKIIYVGDQKSVKSKSGLGSRSHSERETVKQNILKAGEKSSLAELKEAISGQDSLAAAEAIWTLRRSGWASAAAVIGTGVFHKDWRVRRLALQQLRELGNQHIIKVESLIKDSSPEVQLAAALSYPDESRSKAVVKALISGAAQNRRLRFTGALEIARYGEAEDFATLLASDDPEIRLAGLIALDEAFYESSQGFRGPAAKKSIADIARKVLTRFIAQPGKMDISELLDIARRWPHKDLKATVQKSVLKVLMKENPSLIELSQGLTSLQHLKIPFKTAEINKAVTQQLIKTQSNKYMSKAEKVALLKVLNTGLGEELNLPILKTLVEDESSLISYEAADQLGNRFKGNKEAVRYCYNLALNKKKTLQVRMLSIATLVKLEETLRQDKWLQFLQSTEQQIVTVALRSLQKSTDTAGALELVKKANLQSKAFESDRAFTLNFLNGSKPLVKIDKQQLRSRVLKKVSKGNVSLGRIVYRSHSCFSCHETKVAMKQAPKLEGIANNHGADYLIDSILFPDKVVKTGFLTQIITFKNGKVIMGKIKRNIYGDSKYDQVIDEKGRSKLYRQEEVISVRTVSAMPAGLEYTMSEAELVDLLAYLSSLKENQ